MAGAEGGGAAFSAGVAEDADSGCADVVAAGTGDVALGAEGVAVAAGEDPVVAGGVWLLATLTPTRATAKAATLKRRQPFKYAISTLQTC